MEKESLFKLPVVIKLNYTDIFMRRESTTQVYILLSVFTPLRLICVVINTTDFSIAPQIECIF